MPTRDAWAEGVDPVTEMWAMADLATPMAVRVAATLRLADHIAEGRATAAEIADHVGVDVDALERVLRHLARVGVLRRDEGGRLALTERGEVLRADHDSGLRAPLDIEGAIGRGDLSFVHLLYSIRTGEPAFPVLYGRAFWEDLAAEPARSASFDALMGSDIGADAPQIAAAYDWGSLGHVVDVGGGNGSLMMVLLREHPTLRGTVVELPGAADAARTAFAEAGLADRADAVSGSFFDPLPAGAGGYLLSAIVHNWEDESAQAILRRCAEAAGAGGRVFILEKVGAEGESPRTVMDLRMLVYFGGRERNVEELVALSSGAGLRLVAAHSAGDLSIVELTPG